MGVVFAKVAKILIHGNINMYGVIQLFTVSTNHGIKANWTKLHVDDEIKQALPSLPGMWLTKDQRNKQVRLYWRPDHKKGTASCGNCQLAAVQNAAEIFTSSFSKAYCLFPSIGQLSQGLGAFLMIQDPFTITNSFPLNSEILSREFQI